MRLCHAREAGPFSAEGILRSESTVEIEGGGTISMESRSVGRLLCFQLAEKDSLFGNTHDTGEPNGDESKCSVEPGWLKWGGERENGVGPTQASAESESIESSQAGAASNPA